MTDETISNWLESLARKQPTPGGGAAAALAAATAAALVGMVSNYTTGPKWQDRESYMLEIAQRAEELRIKALGIAAADEEAFQAVGAAYKLHAENDADKHVKQAAIEVALEGAAKPPSDTVTSTKEILTLLQELVDKANPNVASDIAVGASFARSAIESAIVNIEINQAALRSEQTKRELQLTIDEAALLIHEAEKIIKTVREQITS